jgi:hypothetical protein
MLLIAAIVVMGWARSKSGSGTPDNWQEVASNLIRATTAERVWTFFARLSLYKAIHGKGRMVRRRRK